MLEIKKEHDLLILYKYNVNDNVTDLANFINHESDMQAVCCHSFKRYVQGVERNFLSITLFTEIKNYYPDGSSKHKTLYVDVMEGNGLIILGDVFATEISKNSLEYMLEDDYRLMIVGNICNENKKQKNLTYL